MALRQILRSAPETPYSRPPPVHITVVMLKEQARVFSWVFEGSEARPSVSRKNIVAVISDGKSVAKITLFESFATKIKAGQSYMMRGYTLRGQDPPYHINTSKDTMFFRSAPVEVPDALQEEAKQLLCPSSRFTHLSDVRRAEGLLTVQGEVVEFSGIKRVLVGKDPVPLRTICIKEDQTQITINMWREAAVFPLEVGAQTRLSHLKSSDSAYGFRLQSTAYTALEDTTETMVVGALGATADEEKPGFLKLLVEGDKILDIEEALWLPLEPQSLKVVPFNIKITLLGKTVIAAEATEEEVAQANEI